MIEIILVTSLSFIFALIISLIDKFTKKDETDIKIEHVCSLLPGYNCNACKTGSCISLATLIVKNNETPKKCKPIKEDKVKEINEYLKK